MAAPSELTIPRAKYGLWMGLATLGALVLAAAMAAGMGGESATIRAVLLATAIGAVATFLPAVMVIAAEYWGVAVLVCGAARSLAVIGLAYYYVQTDPSLGSRAVMLPVSAGTMLVLALEVAASVSILSAIERRKAAIRSGGGSQASSSASSTSSAAHS